MPRAGSRAQAAAECAPCSVAPDLAAAPASPSKPALWKSLDSLVDTLLPGRALLSATVVRVRDGSPVWLRNDAQGLAPASTLKIFIADAALQSLGPSYRIPTRLWGRGRQEGATWIGDIVVQGGADPSLDTRAPAARLAEFAEMLQDAGIKRITGRLVALDTLVGAMPEDMWPRDWPLSNIGAGYGAPSTGLNWSLNRVGSVAIAEPRLAALRALRRHLAQRKIAVAGGDSLIARGQPLPADRAKWRPMGTIFSPPLSSLVREYLHESINLYGESFVLLLGSRVPGARDPRKAGLQVVQAHMLRKGIPRGDFEVRDGCGLSRYNIVSSRAPAALLGASYLDTARRGARLVDLLPAGGQGTLRRRFRALPNPSWVRAKTGTLDMVSALVGVLEVPGRDTVAFAFLAQNYTGGSATIRRIQDHAIALLAGVSPTPSVPVPAQVEALEDSLEEARRQADSARVDSLIAPPGGRKPAPAERATGASADTAAPPFAPPSPDSALLPPAPAPIGKEADPAAPRPDSVVAPADTADAPTGAPVRPDPSGTDSAPAAGEHPPAPAGSAVPPDTTRLRPPTRPAGVDSLYPSDRPALDTLPAQPPAGTPADSLDPVLQPPLPPPPDTISPTNPDSGGARRDPSQRDRPLARHPGRAAKHQPPAS